jgi:hypothetical protein
MVAFLFMGNTGDACTAAALSVRYSLVIFLPPIKKLFTSLGADFVLEREPRRAPGKIELVFGRRIG